jgi:TetR/AcrR family transcriptional regulator, regulator of cefoperazone and chloramphenicol sensitivity
MTEMTDSAKALIEAALPIFGLRGLDGASTRDVARSAGKPMSAITYHFGGKEGLYLACARHIGQTIGGFVGTALEDTDKGAPVSVADARANIAMLFGVLIQALNRSETAVFAQFIMREQQEPTEAFDIIYSGMMGRVLARLVSLMTIVADGRSSDIEIRVRVIALMGQVMAFRTARAATLRLTGWRDVGEEERVLIGTVIQSHLAAILNSLEQEHAS